MGALWHILLFILGAALIIKGSNWFLDAAVWFAMAFHIPEIVVGATIISLCTTVPEMVVSVTAATRGETDMAVGNALGSIVSNTAFILGVLLFFASVSVDNRRAFRQNGLFLLTVLGIVMASGIWLREINGWTGLLLVIVLCAYLVNNVRTARLHMTGALTLTELNAAGMEPRLPTPGSDGLPRQEECFPRSSLPRHLGLFAMGIVMVVWGADLLVDNGVAIAEWAGVPTLVISLVFTSLGTSLPELVTTLTSIRKKATNLGIGNLVGANFMNIAQVLGAAALFRALPLTETRSLMLFQLPFTIVLTLLVLGVGLLQKKTHRWNGVLLLFLYACFLLLNLLRERIPVLGPCLFGMQ